MQAAAGDDTNNLAILFSRSAIDSSFTQQLHYHVPVQRTRTRKPQSLDFSINHRTIVTPLDGQTTYILSTRQKYTPRKPGYTNALGVYSIILHSAASMNAERAATWTRLTLSMQITTTTTTTSQSHYS